MSEIQIALLVSAVLLIGLAILIGVVLSHYVGGFIRTVEREADEQRAREDDERRARAVEMPDAVRPSEGPPNNNQTGASL